MSVLYNDSSKVEEQSVLFTVFGSRFEHDGFFRLEPVSIVSHIDKTVFLVNSATNLFKPFLDIGGSAVFAMQRSMRTQQLSDYYNPSTEDDYPTCFVSFGAYASLNMANMLIATSLSAMRDIGLDEGRMRVRLYSGDLAKWECLLQFQFNETVLDDREEKYAHCYGGALTGRVAKVDYYQPALERYKNLLYFIVMYDDGMPKGMELATSDQQLLLRIHEAKHGIAMAPIADLVPVESFSQRRMADSIVGTANLLVGGIRPNASTTNGRTLKKYLSALRYFANENGCTVDQIVDIVARYTLIDYGEGREIDKPQLARMLRDDRCLCYCPK